MLWRWPPGVTSVVTGVSKPVIFPAATAVPVRTFFFFFKGGVELGPWSQDDGANDITTSSCLHSSHTLVKTNTRILQKEHQHKHLLLHHHYTFPSSPSHSPVHLFTTCTDYPDFFQPSFFSLSPRRNMKGRVLWMHTQFYGDVITEV